MGKVGLQELVNYGARWELQGIDRKSIWLVAGLTTVEAIGRIMASVGGSLSEMLAGEMM